MLKIGKSTKRRNLFSRGRHFQPPSNRRASKPLKKRKQERRVKKMAMFKREYLRSSQKGLLIYEQFMFESIP
jgi:hypothetical protein